MMHLPHRKPSLATVTLIALLCGGGLGMFGQIHESAWLHRVAESIAPIGTLWINALQMVVVPLVITQLLAALIRPDKDAAVGASGRGAVLLFLAFLAVAGTITALVTVQWLQRAPLPSDLLHGWQPDAAGAATMTTPVAPITVAEWITSLVPRNPFDAAARGNMLQLLVFTVLFGLAAGRLPRETRASLALTVGAVAATMMTMVHWILLITPVGVFVVMFGLLLKTGIGALEILTVYIVGLSFLLIVWTLVLYPVTAVWGRMPLRRFARGVAPAQLVAAGSQSSLASLPALMQGGQQSLLLPAASTGFVLTLAVSTFKLSQAVAPVFKFILLAHVFGIPLSVPQIAMFLAATLVLSFSVAGVPRGGGVSYSLPLYIAAGIPLEGVVLLEAVRSIPDIFMTVLNVTADMSVATILSRTARSGEPATTPAPIPVTG